MAASPGSADEVAASALNAQEVAASPGVWDQGSLAADLRAHIDITNDLEEAAWASTLTELVASVLVWA